MSRLVQYNGLYSVQWLLVSWAYVSPGDQQTQSFSFKRNDFIYIQNWWRKYWKWKDAIKTCLVPCFFKPIKSQRSRSSVDLTAHAFGKLVFIISLWCNETVDWLNSKFACRIRYLTENCCIQYPLNSEVSLQIMLRRILDSESGIRNQESLFGQTTTNCK